MQIDKKENLLEDSKKDLRDLNNNVAGLEMTINQLREDVKRIQGDLETVQTLRTKVCRSL